MFHSLQKRVVW